MADKKAGFRVDRDNENDILQAGMHNLTRVEGAEEATNNIP